MALDRFPGAPRGDAHHFMIVADRTAGGEGIAEPVAMLDRQRIGDVGEGRGALVGGDNEIGIVAFVTYHAIRRHD